jgi:hypothetical protein
MAASMRLMDLVGGGGEPVVSVGSSKRSGKLGVRSAGVEKSSVRRAKSHGETGAAGVKRSFARADGAGIEREVPDAGTSREPEVVGVVEESGWRDMRSF